MSNNEKRKFTKPKSSNSIRHNLNELIKIEQARLSIELKRKVSIKETHEIIAKGCGLKEGTIKAMKKEGYYIPSLESALRLAKYFNVPVENIFQLID